jgi:hypothetical protein
MNTLKSHRFVHDEDSDNSDGDDAEYDVHDDNESDNHV